MDPISIASIVVWMNPVTCAHYRWVFLWQLLTMPLGINHRRMSDHNKTAL